MLAGGESTIERTGICELLLSAVVKVTIGCVNKKQIQSKTNGTELSLIEFKL
jgi:hypothetical protein